MLDRSTANQQQQPSSTLGGSMETKRSLTREQSIEFNGIDILRIPLCSIKTFYHDPTSSSITTQQHYSSKNTCNNTTTTNTTEETNERTQQQQPHEPYKQQEQQQPFAPRMTETTTTPTLEIPRTCPTTVMDPAQANRCFNQIQNFSFSMQPQLYSVNTPVATDEEQCLDHQPILHSNASVSTTTTTTFSIPSLFRSQIFASNQCRRVATVGLFLFHILLQMVLNLLCAGQAFLFENFSLVAVLVYVPKIVIGTMIVIAIQRKQVRLLHFLLGALLLDLIYVSMFLVIVYSGTLQLGGQGKRFSETFEMQDHYEPRHLQAAPFSLVAPLNLFHERTGVFLEEVKPKPPPQNNNPPKKQQSETKSFRMEYCISIQFVELAVIFLTLFWTYSLGSSS